MCGSNTLIKYGKDVVCKVCGYRIKDYKRLILEMGLIEFKKFERGIK